MDIPSSVLADSAIARQNVAFSAIKQNADQSEALAKIIEETVRSAPVSTTRGTNLNINV